VTEFLALLAVQAFLVLVQVGLTALARRFVATPATPSLA